jgi:hypothetical protein
MKSPLPDITPVRWGSTRLVRHPDEHDREDVMTKSAAEDQAFHVFRAALRAVTGCDSHTLAEGLMGEFDRALPLPSGSASTLVASVVEGMSKATVGGPFADASVVEQHDVFRRMLESDDALVREVANLVVPFCAFAYWSDAIRWQEPSTRVDDVDPSELPPWREIGFPGASNGHLGTFRRGVPRGFRVSADEREGAWEDA